MGRYTPDSTVHCNANLKVSMCCFKLKLHTCKTSINGKSAERMIRPWPEQWYQFQCLHYNIAMHDEVMQCYSLQKTKIHVSYCWPMYFHLSMSPTKPLRYNETGLLPRMGKPKWLQQLYITSLGARPSKNWFFGGLVPRLIHNYVYMYWSGP